MRSSGYKWDQTWKTAITRKTYVFSFLQNTSYLLLLFQMKRSHNPLIWRLLGLVLLLHLCIFVKNKKNKKKEEKITNVKKSLRGRVMRPQVHQLSLNISQFIQKHHGHTLELMLTCQIFFFVGSVEMLCVTYIQTGFCKTTL